MLWGRGFEIRLMVWPLNEVNLDTMNDTSGNGGSGV